MTPRKMDNVHVASSENVHLIPQFDHADFPNMRLFTLIIFFFSYSVC